MYTNSNQVAVVVTKAMALLLVTALCGCSGDHATRPKHQRSDAVIMVGQDYADAHGVAVASGYRITDAAQLELLPQPTGFVVDLPDDRALIVLCSPETHRVSAMEVVSHWSVSKSARAYEQVQRFKLPPAKPIL